MSWIVPIEAIETELPDGDPQRRRVGYVLKSIVRAGSDRIYIQTSAREKAHQYSTKAAAEEAQSLCIHYQTRQRSGIKWPELRPLPVEEVA